MSWMLFLSQTFNEDARFAYMQKQVKSPVCVAAKDLLLNLYSCITLLPYVLGDSGNADIVKEKVENT